MTRSSEDLARAAASTVRAEGFILTGGQSSRFGSDKALHHFRGRPMAMHVAAALRSCTTTVTVVGDPGRHAALGLPVIQDQAPGMGPLAGIVTALRTARTRWALIAACDMPFLTPEPLSQLLAAAAQSSSAAVVARTPDRRLQPLCAAYAKPACEPFAAALRNGSRKVMDAVQLVAWEALDLADGRPLTNINRLGDISSLP